MKKRFFALALMIAPLAMSAFAAPAREKQKGRPHSESDVGVQASVSVFSAGDRELIRGYLSGLPPGGLPPGLAKRGSLPPGLAKQLRKNGVLPPGLQKKITPFPVELERRLPPLAPDLERVFIEGRAVIHNRKTGAILDIFVAL